MSWGVGDRCELANLRRGEVVSGVVETVRGRRMVIITDDGKRFSVADDSPFVTAEQVRAPEPSEALS